MSVADLYRGDPMFQCRCIWKVNKVTKRWYCGKCKTHRHKLTTIEWTRVDQTDKFTREYVSGKR